MDRLRPLHVLVAFAVLGLALLSLNGDLPFVRNDLVYARAAEHVIEHGYDPRPVVADSALSYDKPVGFAWLGAPLVRAFGAHSGLRILSLAGTVLFLLAALRFARSVDATRDPTRSGPNALTPGEETAFVALCAFNPITVYQTWSAHPDALFAAIVLAAWADTIDLVRAPDRAPWARAALLAALCVAGLALKNYALILLACVPAYVVLRARTLARQPGRPWSMLAALALALGAFALFAWAGRAGVNPFVRIAGEGGGAGQYGQGALAIGALGTLLQVVLALALNLGLALLLAFRSPRRLGALVVPLIAFAGPYVAGLMAFPTSYYNMRYFLPLLPLGALAAVLGARAFRPAVRHAVLGAHAAVMLLLVAVFDVAPLHALAEPALPRWVFEKGYGKQGLLDNLRMAQHRTRAAELARANTAVEPGGVLYMVNCGYYRDATHGVYEKDGLLRPDIRTRYVDARTFRPEEARSWAWTFYADRRPLERHGNVTELGPGLYRIDRAIGEGLGDPPGPR